MSKHSPQKPEPELYEKLVKMSRRSEQDARVAKEVFGFGVSWSRAGTKMKKFRSQLLHRWLLDRFEPCRVADIGGGKGLLTELLLASGWDSTVSDPTSQSLPSKYKDITTGKRVRVPPSKQVPRIDSEFEPEMAKDFDLLIGMHAHGCNVKVIDAATDFGCGFVLFPCCVIDEPFYPCLGVHWLESLLDYALWKGRVVYPFRLKFKGQNIGLCAIGRCQLRSGQRRS
jgi:hypothetical protein